MALASAKQLLDELMGRDRDLNLTEKKGDFTWDGPDICKNYLVKFCPHDLFVNTKADLGACSKIHDERLKKEYESSSRFQKMGYEEDFLRFCQSMLSDVEKRIRRAKQRLALSNQHSESQPTQPPKNNNEEKITVLTERINGLLVQVENLGCEGKVEEAQGIMKLCDQLKEEREALKKQVESSHWLQTAEIAAAQEKQMEVCDVCGAFLIVGDAQQRVDDHLQGKQHVGYARLKEAVEEILSSREKERYDRERQREKDREDRRRVKEEEDRKREERRKTIEDERRRELDKHRGRDRDRDRDRSKRRSRSREARRSRSRGKGGSRRSRSRDRSKKDRERTRHRSRSKEHKNIRSRSRDSGRHSRRKSNSHSPDHRKERREKKEKSREQRRHSYENGDSSSEKRTEDREHSGSKGHSLAGDSDH